MLQTRAQFGSYGSLLVVVIVMYTGFFASNAVLGGQAVANLFSGLSVNLGIVVTAVISVVTAVVGYRLIHRLTAVMSIVSGITLVLAFIWVLEVNGMPAGSLSAEGTTATGFMATVSLAALWQIAYAPYVSDCTRYMPPETGARGASWGTWTGCVAGSLLSMILGAPIGAAAPDADTVTGLTSLTRGIGTLVIAAFGIGITANNAMNMYCGALSTLTVGQTLVPRWVPRARSRAVVTISLTVVSLTLAILGKDNFLVNYANFLLLLAVLIPWTAINLVDYHLVRHGDYDIDSMFRSDGGVYGRVNGVAVVCYVVGIAIQVPFLSSALYTGPLATALGGVDVSWIVGLLVVSLLHLVLMRRRGQGGAGANPGERLPVLVIEEDR